MYKYHRELAEVNDSLAKCYAGIGSFCYFSLDDNIWCESICNHWTPQLENPCINEAICHGLAIFLSTIYGHR